ncbi:SDR family NAD(P)-dependent oxidoreductase [Paenibacillus sp. Z6-24]
MINNTGFGLYGTFAETDLEQEANMIDVNIKALTIMTKLFMPDMVKLGQGGVINVASLKRFSPNRLQFSTVPSILGMSGSDIWIAKKREMVFYA